MTTMDWLLAPGQGAILFCNVYEGERGSHCFLLDTVKVPSSE